MDVLLLRNFVSEVLASSTITGAASMRNLALNSSSDTDLLQAGHSDEGGGSESEGEGPDHTSAEVTTCVIFLYTISC